MVTVVFCLYGDLLRKEARMMIASCRRFGYRVVQLTDEATAELDVDQVIRRPMDCPQVTFRYRHLAEMEPPYISLDVDLLVVKDISPMIDMDFDVTMTKRDAAYGMIYNGGVFSVQKRGFIEECSGLIEQMPPEWQDWTGGQRAMATVAGKYKVKELDCREWNYSPNSSSDRPENVRVLHFKGPRKNMMPEAYTRLFK